MRPISLQGFRVSRLHVPHIRRIKVRKRYYQVLLIVGSVGIYAANRYFHEWESLIATVTSLLFAVDPTLAEKTEV